MGKKMRAANHHGKGGAIHPSRRFDLEKADHIDAEKAKMNIYWTWNHGRVKNEGGKAAVDFREAEIAYYENFEAHRRRQNEKNKAAGNSKRDKGSAEEVYKSRNSQPEGSLLYIGCKDNRADVDPAVLWACFEEYREWEKEASVGFYVPLTAALHVDERGQWHVEERGIYQYKDSEGNLAIGQVEALRQAGFELPNPDEPRSKGNNYKMTWDSLRRDKWHDIAEAHGFDIIREPNKHGEHLPLEQWQQVQDYARNIKNWQKVEAAKLQEREKALEGREAALNEREAALDAREAFQNAREEALPGFIKGIAASELRKAVEAEIDASRAAGRKPDRAAAVQAAKADIIAQASAYSGNVRQNPTGFGRTLGG